MTLSIFCGGQPCSQSWTAGVAKIDVYILVADFIEEGRGAENSQAGKYRDDSISDKKRYEKESKG